MGTSTIHPRTILDTANGKLLCKEHLAPLPDNLESLYDAVQDECNDSRNDSNFVPDPWGPCCAAGTASIADITLVYEDMSLLVGTGKNDQIPDDRDPTGHTMKPKYGSGEIMQAISIPGLENYINSICKYTNKLRSGEKKRLKEGLEKKRLEKESLEKERLEKEKAEKRKSATPDPQSEISGEDDGKCSEEEDRSRSKTLPLKQEETKPRERSPIDNSISCVFVPTAKFSDLSANDYDEVQEAHRRTNAFDVLDGLGLTRNRDDDMLDETGLFGLDYLFIP